MVLQWNAVIGAAAAKDFEAGSKFYANIVSSVGASAEVLDMLWREFRMIRLRGVIRLSYSSMERFITRTLNIIKWFGAAAGMG